jgi:hypothetical protein
MSQLFKLQNHSSTRVVQLLVQVFHLVFHLSLVHPLWCSTLEYTERGVSPVRRAACCNSMDCYGLWCQA